MSTLVHGPAIRIALALSLLAATGPASGQEPPLHVTEVSNFDQSGQSYADVWGDGDFAYLAHFGQARVDIIDIAVPSAPVLAATYTTGVGGSAQDVKVGDGLMFVGIESGTPGCQIVDVRNPFAPVKLTDVTVRSNIHNQFYDNGWLYLADSAINRIWIVDLRSYDPDSPPSTISSATWTVTGVGGDFVHDITVQNGRMYASAWDSIRVFDVSNLDAGPPVELGSAPGSSVHAAWASDDGRFLTVAEEREGGGLALYEVIDSGSGVVLERRDSYFVDGSRAYSTHNPLILGNRVYAAWYEVGVQVLEIDPASAQWILVAAFDTTALNGNNSIFGGNWGVYPFLGEDRVLASDRDHGLFVLDVDPQGMFFSYPEGRPATVVPDTPTEVVVELAEVGAPVDPGAVFLMPDIDGVPQGDVAMADLGGGRFAGDLPGAGCGSELTWRVRAGNTNGDTFIDPVGGESYRADVATALRRRFDDRFDADLGWTVDNFSVTTGAWERGDPRGTGAQPEECPADGGGAPCFFTDQGPVGGDLGDADVDGGPTVLTSPTVDLAAGDGVVRYDYWMFNDDGDDSLIVEVSDDGATWSEATRYTGGGGGWREDAVAVGDLVPPSSTFQVRFSVADNPNNSITEAALDHVRVDLLECDPAGLAIDLSQTTLVRGRPATFTATGAGSGETVFFLLTTTGSGIGTCPPALGDLCLGLLDPLVVLGSATADAGGTAELTLTIPGGAPLVDVWTQAVVQRGAGGADSVASNVVASTIEP